MAIYMFSLCILPSFFFFNDTATTEIYTLSLHDALPISAARGQRSGFASRTNTLLSIPMLFFMGIESSVRSEEHTSELQSLAYLVCRLLLEKKKNTRSDCLPSWPSRSVCSHSAPV